MKLRDLLDTYVLHLRAIGHRERSIDRYIRDVRRFVASLPEDATPDDLTAATIRAHQRERAAELATATVVGLLTAVRSFCRFLLEEELLSHDPTSGIRYPRRRAALPAALAPAELTALLEAITEPEELTERERWYWRRNRRAIFLMLYAGLRLGEVAALCWRDVDFTAGTIRVIDGKGGKQRVLAIHPRLRAEIYPASVGAPPQWAVAGKMGGENLGPKALAHLFEVWLPRRGIPDVHAHRLRHTFATELMNAGAALPEIQAAMGHEDISTTQVYLMVDMSRVRAAIDRLPTWR